MVPASQPMRIRSLARMARALGRSDELPRLLELAAEEACVALGAASVSVSRLVPGTLRLRTLVNVGDLGPEEERGPEDETYVIEDFKGLRFAVDGLQFWTSDLDDPDCLPQERDLLTWLGKGAALGAPVFVDGRLWGEFYATRHHGEPGFDELDLACVDALLAILAGAVSRSLRETSLEELAYRDPLTGLQNRRSLDLHAAEAFTAAGRPNVVTAVTIDINRLKQVNDTLGHVTGDHLIQAVARDLESAFARLPGALVARVGGDEFTVLITNDDPQAAVRISDELCERSWRFGDGVGVSAGAASLVLGEDSTATPTDLFAAADRAQYLAKRGRLSRTVVADDAD